MVSEALEVTSKSHGKHTQFFWDAMPCRYCVNRRFGGTYRLNLQGIKLREQRTTLKMEAIRSSETSVYTIYTRRHIPEDGILWIFVSFGPIFQATFLLKCEVMVSGSAFTRNLKLQTANVPFHVVTQVEHIYFQPFPPSLHFLSAEWNVPARPRESKCYCNRQSASPLKRHPSVTHGNSYIHAPSLDVNWNNNS
jgi:hypothetical protein